MNSEHLNLNPFSYPNMGLSHSLSELDSIESEIRYWDTKRQSKYADAICKRYAKDLNFLKSQIDGYDHKDSTGWNSTSFGNMAYLALHAPMPYSKICADALEYHRKQPRQSTCNLM